MTENETDIGGVLAAALQHHRAGLLPQAEALYRRILAADPGHARALHLVGALAFQAGRYGEAAEHFARSLASDATDPFSHCNLGLALQALGRLDEALLSYGRALALKPDLVDAHYNLGNVLQQLGRPGEAVASYSHALDLRPDHAEAHGNLGVALMAQGRSDDAEASYLRALAVNPTYADAWGNLGNVLLERKQPEQAVRAYERALALRPAYPQAHYNRGSALMALARRDDALASFARALAFDPGYVAAYYNSGLVLAQLGRFEEAATAYRQALALDPDNSEARCNLGNVLHEQGLLDDALACYARVIETQPEHLRAQQSRLMCLNYSSTLSTERLLVEHRRFGAQHASVPPAAFGNDRAPDRRLRIGYVSPDFRAHSVAWFLEPVLRGHDRAAVEIFCYAEVSRPDGVTEILRPLAAQWRDTVGLSDEAVAAQIRADAIDILVDLAGHTAGNRLMVFAGKPAPVQVSWLGYPSSTGLGAIDYRLVDAVTDPPNVGDALAAETLVRLEGGFLCYAPAHGLPDPPSPPCLAGAPVTFGSFNNPAKLSEATLDAWAALLQHRPGTRLLLKGRPFDDAPTRALYLGRLVQRGVAAGRVELIGWAANPAEHLALYGRIDVALDPFPYNGTTTSCEALWMGVPVVTLAGDRHAARVGASLLSRLGLGDLVASNADDYVAMASRLADDPQRLAELRAGLRGRMLNSSLCDARGFTAGLEAAYRAMWRTWCAG